LNAMKAELTEEEHLIELKNTERSFVSPEAFQGWLRRGNSCPDYVIVSGIFFTMEEYDSAGTDLSYGNLKHKQTLTVTTENRYESTKDAVVEMYDMCSYRPDIHYME